MKLDLSAIKNKIAALNGGGSGNRDSSDIQLWKPDVGEFKVRGMHWPARLKLTNPGEPFVERHFYYNIAKYGILAPAQFGKDDPVQDLRMNLFKSGNPDDKLIAKKLFSSMRCYMPIVVKTGNGADPEKVLIWSFGKGIYEKLLSYFLKEDIGDYLDPSEGFDLDVVISRKGGKPYNDTDIELARRSSKLAPTEEGVQALFDAVPDISTMWTLKSAEEIKAELDRWLDGDEDDGSTGHERTQPVKTALDDLVEEVEKPAKKEKAKEKKVEKKAKEVEVDESDEEEVESTTDDLDSAFDELMND